MQRMILVTDLRSGAWAVEHSHMNKNAFSLFKARMRASSQYDDGCGHDACLIAAAPQVESNRNDAERRAA
ncbi:hypothetical protein GCM10023322_38240 [Rugosimonospora acidiphila]|uniref:Uncharacterized protein n=1 Tax=Rugosimonospora acidiphila TaxID=556531 RepID=A0ABP9RVV1_9ACTN